MFKVSYVSTIDGLKEARAIMSQIYDEAPKHWPYGLSPEHFDGGVYLVREKRSNASIGFCGWQERWEARDLHKRAKHDEIDALLRDQWGVQATKVGYYSIGILQDHRRNGFAKEALTKLIRMKSAGVDCVRAMIMASNEPSLALADSLGVSKLVKNSSKLERGTDYAGASATGLAGAGIMATGIGKSAPSFLDLSQKMFTGPSGDQLFSALADINPASATRLRSLAFNHPQTFKMALMGVRMRGVDPETHSRMLSMAFSIRPSTSQLGDVLVSGPKEEMLGGIGRMRHAVSGTGMHHTALGLPERMNSWVYQAGRGQGIQNWRGDLSDMDHASTVLRPKFQMDPEKLTETANEAFSKPYSYGRLRRLGVQEAISMPWTEKANPTVSEKVFSWLGSSPTLRKNLSFIPGLKDQLIKNRAASRMCEGHVCSTAIADALQKANPAMFAGRNPLGVSPGDFLRATGKNFDVAALNIPEALRTRPQLLMNEAMKFGPMASRAAVALPFLGAAGYLYHRATRPEDSWTDQLKKWVPGKFNAKSFGL